MRFTRPSPIRFGESRPNWRKVNSLPGCPFMASEIWSVTSVYGIPRASMPSWTDFTRPRTMSSDSWSRSTRFSLLCTVVALAAAGARSIAHAIAATARAVLGLVFIRLSLLGWCDGYGYGRLLASPADADEVTKRNSAVAPRRRDAPERTRKCSESRWVRSSAWLLHSLRTTKWSPPSMSWQTAQTTQPGSRAIWSLSDRSV